MAGSQTHPWRRLAWRVLAVGAGVGALNLLFTNVAGFSERQGAVLFWLFVVMILVDPGRLRALREFVLDQPDLPKPEDSFVPYRAGIRVHLPHVLTDFDLASLVILEGGGWDWQHELEAGIAALPPGRWNIWHSPFNLEVISPALVYHCEKRYFATRVRMSATLSPLQITQDNQVVITHEDLLTSFPPRLSLVGSVGGLLELKITLPNPYWEQVRHKGALKDLLASFQPFSNDVEVTLAVIPPEEFGVISRWRASGREARQDAVRRRAEARVRFGWKGEAQKETDYTSSETADASNSIEHKYAMVWHSEL
jgi:hypothetical protein